MELTLIITSVILLETSYLSYNAYKKTHVSKKYRSPIVCDTSALIDGRITSIAQSGFLSGELIIPRSVTRELQYMADLPDHTKRERARFGLDVISQLQAMDSVSVVIYDDGETHASGVDEQLLVITRQLSARLCTIDYNLNKVARTENIPVININELAHALRPMHLPGEEFAVAVVGSGQNKDQGVGYLDDGTMVVIDGAKKLIGSSVHVETIRMLQTEAGRMVFAKLLKRPELDQAPAQVKHNRPKNRKTKRTPEDALVKLANS